VCPGPGDGVEPGVFDGAGPDGVLVGPALGLGPLGVFPGVEPGVEPGVFPGVEPGVEPGLLPGVPQLAAASAKLYIALLNFGWV